MSFVGTQFEYNGISSDTMGVMLVSINTGFLQRNFGLQKTINREKLRHKDLSIHYNSEKQTYPIPITICKINGHEPWTDDEWMQVSQWLFPDDQFHEFISEDHQDLIYMLQFTKGSFSDNYNNEGYIELESEMQYPYLLSQLMLSEYDLTDNNTTTIIEIENRANAVDYYYPIIQFETQDITNLKIKNLTVGGEETIFNNLTANEILSVDNENQQIESSTGDERVSNFNFVFTRLTFGINRLEVTGKGVLKIRCQFPIML